MTNRQLYIQIIAQAILGYDRVLDSVPMRANKTRKSYYRFWNIGRDNQWNSQMGRLDEVWNRLYKDYSKFRELDEILFTKDAPENFEMAALADARYKLYMREARRKVWESYVNK